MISCVVNVVDGQARKRQKITEAEFSLHAVHLSCGLSPEYLPVAVTILSENV